MTTEGRNGSNGKGIKKKKGKGITTRKGLKD
jgi:hypothetical protein